MASAGFARVCNALGIRIYSEADDGNLFLSPVSIAACLGTLLAGARGATADELADALGVAPPEIPDVARQLIALRARRGPETIWDDEQHQLVEVEADFFTLRNANALFVQRAYPLLESYRQLLATHFEAEAFEIDFGQCDTAVARINGWVDYHTNGRITDLLDVNDLDESTRFVPVNAVYFLARWLHPFPEQKTSPVPFHLGDGSGPIDVPMMRQTEEFRYFVDDEIGLEAVEVPYLAMSLFVLLPHAGRMDAVESAMREGLLDRLPGGVLRSIDLALPRFAIESSWRLGPLLQALGIRRAFDRELADFGGITSDPDGLFVSEVVHRAAIRVDENGTEAAAATAATVLAAGFVEEPSEPYPFIVDRPFLLLIRDDVTETIVFLGRVMNPLG